MDDPTEILLGYLGANVRRWRLRRHLTQEDLAERAEVDLRWVQRVERAAVNLRFRSFARIASALGVKPAQLLRQAEKEPVRVGRPKKRKVAPRK